MPELQEWKITDFTAGLVDKIDDNLLPPGAARDCRNFISVITGKLSKRNGQAKVNSTALSGGIQGLHAFYSNTGVRYLVVASAGKVYYWNGSAMTEIYTGLDTTAMVNFENCIIDGTDYIVGFNGVDNPFKWDGTNAVSELLDYRQVTLEKPTTSDYTVYALAHKPVKAGSVTVMSNRELLAEADYTLDTTNGTIAFPVARVNAVTKGNTIAYLNYSRFEVGRPFKPGSAVTVYDKSDNVLTPDLVDYEGGYVNFGTSQQEVAPLTISYEWVDVIEVDYAWKNGNAPTKGRYPVMHKGRLFVTTSDEKTSSQVWWSEINDIENWPPVNYWEVKSGDGDEITNMKSFMGELLIFKKHSIHSLRGVDFADFRLDELETQVGCVGPRGAVVNGPEVYFVNEEGVYRFNGMKATNLSRDRIPQLWEGVNGGYLHNAVVTSWNGLILVAVPHGSSTTNNMVIAVDVGSGGFWPWTGINASCYLSFVEENGLRLYSGNPVEGYVYEQDVGSDDAGVPVNAYWEGTAFDAGSSERLKKAKKVFVEDAPEQELPATIKLSPDYGDFVELTLRGSSKGLRMFSISTVIKDKWRRVTPRIEHSQIGGCEIRSFMVPFKMKEKPKVKGGV